MSQVVSLSPSQGLSLRANFSWTLVGNLIFAASQWGFLIVIAKLSSPEVVGQFALGLAVTAPVVMFTNLKLRTVQATDAQGDFSFADYLGHRILAAGLASLTVIGITVNAGYALETSLVIMAIGVAKVIESFSDIFYGFLQLHERMDQIAKSMMLRGPLGLFVLAAVLYLSGSIVWASIGLVVAWLVVLLLFDIRSGRSLLGGLSDSTDGSTLRPKWRPAHLQRLTMLALPLGFSMMLLSLNTNMPRYFIEHYLGERELGVFAAMAYLIVAGLTVVHALGQTVVPRLARFWAANELQAFQRFLVQLSLFGVGMGVVGASIAALFGSEILTLLYGQEYANDIECFFLLMVAAGVSFVANFLGYGVSATRAFHHQLAPFVLAALVTVAGSFYLVPTYGLIGAAWVVILQNLVTSLAFGVVLMILIRRRQRAEVSV